MVIDKRTPPDDLPENVQVIYDDGDLRRYRIELPNMADDDLGLFTGRLYMHYKRVCGGTVDGECYESVRTTAKATGMSPTKVIESREVLVTEGWITAERVDDGTYHIRILDRWLENMQRYNDRSKFGTLPKVKRSKNGITPRSKFGTKESTTASSEETTIVGEGEQPKIRSPKQQFNDAIFDAILAGSFNEAPREQVKGRVGKAVGAVRAAFPELSGEDLGEFYRWARGAFNGRDLSRDPEKLVTDIAGWLKARRPRQSDASDKPALVIEDITPEEAAAGLGILTGGRNG